MEADPTVVAGHVYTTLFENDRVRLLATRLAPGASTVMHDHPDMVVFNRHEGRVRFTTGSGEIEERDLPAETAWWHEATRHATSNVGDTEIRSLIFEVKIPPV